MHVNLVRIGARILVRFAVGLVIGRGHLRITQTVVLPVDAVMVRRGDEVRRRPGYLRDGPARPLDRILGLFVEGAALRAPVAIRVDQRRRVVRVRVAVRVVLRLVVGEHLPLANRAHSSVLRQPRVDAFHVVDCVKRRDQMGWRTGGLGGLPWLQGSTRSFSPSMYSSRQITHISYGSPRWYLHVGIFFSVEAGNLCLLCRLRSFTNFTICNHKITLRRLLQNLMNLQS